MFVHMRACMHMRDPCEYASERVIKRARARTGGCTHAHEVVEGTTSTTAIPPGTDDVRESVATNENSRASHSA